MKYLVPLSESKISSIRGSAYESRMVVLFNSRKSVHILKKLPFFLAMTMLDAYGEYDGLMMSAANESRRWFCTTDSIAGGILRCFSMG